jgi:hypothetical protein
MLQRLILITFCLLFCLGSFAQMPSAKAVRLYNKAQYYKAKKKVVKACQTMQKAIKAYSAYRDAYSALGQWYFEMHKFDSAAMVFKQAAFSCYGGKRDFSKPWGRSLIFASNPTEGLKALGMGGSENDPERKQLMEQAYFIIKSMAKPYTDTPQDMRWRISSPNADLFPFISADTSTFYFTRRINNMDMDFFYAKPDSCGGWLAARNMGSPPNTPDQEVGQTISADGHYLFFTRCENFSDNGWDAGGCDLYMAYRASSDTTWSVPQSFGGTINTPAYEGMGCLSPDNRSLYFVSDRPGGYGGMDIWVANFENGLWREPRNLGPKINTPNNEMTPFLHIDNNTLYFASNGHTGMGGYDLYMCRRINDTDWTTPVNMGYPINTPFDELSECVSVDGKKFYFSSDRDSLAGNYDIYQMDMPKQFRPIAVNYIAGYVYDSISKSRLNYTSIYVSDAKKGDTIYHFISNRGDGSFMITLPAGGSYAFSSDRIGYLEMMDTISFSDTDHYVETPFTHNIALLPQDYQKPVSDTLVLTVHFPRNGYKLTDTDSVMIRNAMLPWLEKKDIVVNVNGFTDNTGTPMINEQLSYQRANLVTSYIFSLGGIDPSVIHSQGWGEANPRYPNDVEENQSKNRRVEVVITY